MNNTTIKISVMMCAYNAGDYIRESIESVLKQTYKHFELVIVDDGSTDNTGAIIRSYHDPRIRLVTCKHDYIYSLNVGLRQCKGDYIARLDADDTMMPDRLEKQVSMMDTHPEISVCFSWGLTIGEADNLIGHYVQEDVEHPQFWLLTGNMFMHSSAMIRKGFLDNHHLRYKRYDYAEDYKLWVDMAFCGARFHVIPEPLFRYRLSASQVSVQFHDEQNETRLVIQQEIVEKLLKIIDYPARQDLVRIYHLLLKLNAMELVNGDEVIAIMFRLIKRTKVFV